MGHSRRFPDVRVRSAIPPIAAVLLQRANSRKGPEGDIISSSSLRQRFCELAGRIDEKLGERAERTVLQRHDSTLDGGRRQGDWQDLHVGMCMEQSQF